MVDFTQELRHCCRNAKCRMKLKTPVENEHHAFCTPGRYSRSISSTALFATRTVSPAGSITRSLAECVFAAVRLGEDFERGVRQRARLYVGMATISFYMA